MSDLVDKILAIDAGFDAAGVPHAFAPPSQVLWVFDALPDGVTCDDASVTAVVRDGQVRLWWDTTPVDLFFNTTAFHGDAASRTRRKPLAGRDIPFLSCSDLAVFKVFSNRTRDWADLEDMAALDSLDVDRVATALTRYLGTDDRRIAKLQELTSSP